MLAFKTRGKTEFLLNPNIPQTVFETGVMFTCERLYVVDKIRPEYERLFDYFFGKLCVCI